MATFAVAERADLTGAQWAMLGLLLPSGTRGRPPEYAKHKLIDGIRWRVRAGAPWRDVPSAYGQAEPPGGRRAEPADHGLGRSRGGLTTKVHLACEQGQKPCRSSSPRASAATAAIRAVLEGIRAPAPA